MKTEAMRKFRYRNNSYKFNAITRHIEAQGNITRNNPFNELPDVAHVTYNYSTYPYHKTYRLGISKSTQFEQTPRDMEAYCHSCPDAECSFSVLEGRYKVSFIKLNMAAWRHCPKMKLYNTGAWVKERITKRATPKPRRNKLGGLIVWPPIPKGDGY